MKYRYSWLVLSVIACTSETQFSGTHTTRRLITIMLDPADAKNRLIEDTFERGLTLPCAQAIKKRLEREHNSVRIILTRFPGETLEPLQNAVFANTLGVDFYLTLLFFRHQDGPSPVYLYHLLYHPVTDFWHQVTKEPALYPYTKAYLFNIHSSHHLGTLLYQELKKLNATYQYEMKTFLGIPFLPLAGIIAPSVALEIGLKDKEDWQRFIEPIAQALHPLITALKSDDI